MWHIDSMAELARQLTFSPLNKKREQLAGAQELVEQIDPQQEYPWDFVVYRLTGFRGRTPSTLSVSGKMLQADLARLMENLSTTLDLTPADVGEEVLLLDQVTQRFNVSTKTIQRWRKRGLVALRYMFPDGVRRLGFRLSAVERFAQRNAQHVQRSARFRQLSEDEKGEIIRRVRRLAQRRGWNLKQISFRLGRKMGRSPETIRYVVRRHDRQNPDQPIFDGVIGPLQPQDRKIIRDCFDRGMGVDSLARRYSRTRSSIYRVVSQEKALAIKHQTIEFIANPLFDHLESEDIIRRVLPARAVQEAAEEVASPQWRQELAYWMRPPSGTPASMVPLFAVEPTPSALVNDAFRRMNYAKARAFKLQQQLDAASARSSEIAELEGLLAQAAAIKNQLVNSHLRVVISVARKHVRSGQDLLELVSDGNMWLIRAVDTFDFSRGVKFSVYLTYVLMKNFARRRAEQITRGDARMVTGQDALLDEMGTQSDRGVPEEVDTLMLGGMAAEAVRKLPQRERDLLTAHYGLEPGQGAMSLSQLAEKMGVTKARVRQVETRALRRLRSLLETGQGQSTVLPGG